MIFESVEFYVIAAFVAAAVVAFFCRPASRGAARQFLLAGTLTPGDDDTPPSIELLCNDDGTVTLTRHGVSGVGHDGAVSLAVNVVGFDIEVQERPVAGRWPATGSLSATFTLNFLGRERYHLAYTSESAGLFAATSLNVRPGIHIVKPLQ